MECIRSNDHTLRQDEVLAHRLGLVPIFADPRKFELKKEKDDQTDATTLVFRLEVRRLTFVKRPFP